MKHQERSQSIGALFIGLVVVIVIIIASISTLDQFSQNKALPIQSTGLQTAIMGNTLTPIMSGTQTVSYLITQKAIVLATELRITRTPFATQIPQITGTSEDVRVKVTGKLLGLDVLNGWSGLVDGNEIVVYAGSLLDDPEQGAIGITMRLPYRFLKEAVLTPARHGGVRVVAEQNNRLTLQSVDGETFYFDVPSRRFVASLTEVVPMPTELSTEVP